jgi:hypothetical protein
LRVINLLARLFRCSSFALAAALSSVAAGSSAGATDAPVLIELFTAEGCSSCPLADHFLAQLDAAQPIHGAHLIVLSEHVDYWDRLGWRDPYSSKALTDRQTAYERSLKVNEPFTPHFIVDGTTDMRLSRRERISEQLLAAAAAPKVPVRVESLHIAEGSAPAISGVVLVSPVTGGRSCELFVAVALDHAYTEVLRGENRGQHLTHVAVLRELASLGTVPPGTEYRQSFSIRLPPGLVAPLRVIAFLQQPGLGAVIGAAEQNFGDSASEVR